MKQLKPTLSLLVLAFMLTTAMKCEKETTQPEPQLPAETQTGAGTFGCLVDGKVFIPKGKFPYAGLTASIQFEILNFATSKSNENIVIIINNFSNVGSYSLTSNSTVEYSIGGVVYKCDSGTFEVNKFDKSEKILAGRFNFIAKNQQSGKTVTITDGRFDVRYSN